MRVDDVPHQRHDEWKQVEPIIGYAKYSNGGSLCVRFGFSSHLLQSFPLPHARCHSLIHLTASPSPRHSPSLQFPLRSSGSLQPFGANGTNENGKCASACSAWSVNVQHKLTRPDSTWLSSRHRRCRRIQSACMLRAYSVHPHNQAKRHEIDGIGTARINDTSSYTLTHTPLCLQGECQPFFATHKSPLGHPIHSNLWHYVYCIHKNVMFVWITTTC